MACSPTGPPARKLPASFSPGFVPTQPFALTTDQAGFGGLDLDLVWGTVLSATGVLPSHVGIMRLVCRAWRGGVESTLRNLVVGCGTNDDELPGNANTLTGVEGEQLLVTAGSQDSVLYEENTAARRCDRHFPLLAGTGWTLRLRGSSFDRGGFITQLEHQTPLQQLTHVILYQDYFCPSFDDTCFRACLTLPEITVLSVYGSLDITDEGVDGVLEDSSGSGLRILQLMGSPQITCCALASICNLQLLEHLDVSGTEVDGDLFDLVCELPLLTCLVARRCPWLRTVPTNQNHGLTHVDQRGSGLRPCCITDGV